MRHQNTFQQMCLALIKESKEGDPSHEDQMDKLRRLFPKAQKWFDWQTMANVEVMLFPTLRARSKDASEGTRPPNLTTNGQEILHRPYYMFAYVNLYINIWPVTILLIVLILSSNGNFVEQTITANLFILPT